MFLSKKKKIKQLSKEINVLSALEIESTPFAQTAFQEKVNLLLLRFISDEANQNPVSYFIKFLKEYKFKSFDLIYCL